jgi:hypothetical protein
MEVVFSFCRLKCDRIHFHAGVLIAKRRNPYEIAERVAILLDTLTADEIAHQ